eukprot:TRINITY_DN19704_c0_g1_i1.p1 TRINITY_DN19704_c0_g1~~TRINITY_DN19704_c0_g1_i1.p1  ORF type:complete len:187 (+),score=28.21 TRINITY_DN19704_c0_g1_i1:99-659(+)
MMRAARFLPRRAVGQGAVGSLMQSPASSCGVAGMSLRSQRLCCSSRSTEGSSERPQGAWDQFWKWTTQRRDYERWSSDWIKETIIVCTVFAIAGSTTLLVVRPCLGYVGIEGSMAEGPWSYRFASIFLISPMYTLIVLTAGTLAGRHATFAKVAARMWKRFLPESARLKLMCEPARRALQQAPKTK